MTRFNQIKRNIIKWKVFLLITSLIYALIAAYDYHIKSDFTLLWFYLAILKLHLYTIFEIKQKRFDAETSSNSKQVQLKTLEDLEISMDVALGEIHRTIDFVYAKEFVDDFSEIATKTMDTVKEEIEKAKLKEY